MILNMHLPLEIVVGEFLCRCWVSTDVKCREELLIVTAQCGSNRDILTLVTVSDISPRTLA